MTTTSHTDERNSPAARALESMDRATRAIEHAVRQMFETADTLPEGLQPEMFALSGDDAAPRDMEMAVDDDPRIAALRLCLASSISTLSIARLLLAEATGADGGRGGDAQLLRDLCEDAKGAGRAAYRAAFVMAHAAEEQAEADKLRAHWQQRHGGAEPARMSERGLQRLWQRIRSEQVSASQFIDFLTPLADLDGLSVSYVDIEEIGLERPLPPN